MSSASDTSRLASSDLLEASLALVTERVSYLKNVAGAVPTTDPEGDPALALASGEWFSCRELLERPEWLARVVVECGRVLGTDDRVVAASLFVQGYAYRVLTPAVATLLINGVVPVADPATTAVAFSRGRVSKLAYGPGSFRDLTGREQPVRDALADPDRADAALRAVVDCAVENHLTPLLRAVRREVRVGERLLWGNVAASASTAFRTVQGCLGTWVEPWGERFFALAPDHLRGLGSFLTLEAPGRHGWFWERTNCCLYDRLPSATRCADCSRTPELERRAAYQQSLES